MGITAVHTLLLWTAPRSCPAAKIPRAARTDLQRLS